MTNNTAAEPKRTRSRGRRPIASLPEWDDLLPQLEREGGAVPAVRFVLVVWPEKHDEGCHAAEHDLRMDLVRHVKRGPAASAVAEARRRILALLPPSARVAWANPHKSCGVARIGSWPAVWVLAGAATGDAHAHVVEQMAAAGRRSPESDEIPRALKVNPALAWCMRLISPQIRSTESVTIKTWGEHIGAGAREDDEAAVGANGRFPAERPGPVVRPFAFVVHDVHAATIRAARKAATLLPACASGAGRKPTETAQHDRLLDAIELLVAEKTTQRASAVLDRVLPEIRGRKRQQSAVVSRAREKGAQDGRFAEWRDNTGTKWFGRKPEPQRRNTR